MRFGEKYTLLVKKYLSGFKQVLKFYQEKITNLYCLTFNFPQKCTHRWGLDVFFNEVNNNGKEEFHQTQKTAGGRHVTLNGVVIHEYMPFTFLIEFIVNEFSFYSSAMLKHKKYSS